MHLPEWDAYDGETENETIEDVREAYPYPSDEKPENVHEGAQTTWLRIHPFNFCAKRPQSENAQLKALQAEGNTDDCNHQDESCNEILECDVQATEDEPDDVS